MDLTSKITENISSLKIDVFITEFCLATCLALSSVRKIVAKTQVLRECPGDVCGSPIPTPLPPTPSLYQCQQLSRTRIDKVKCL